MSHRTISIRKLSLIAGTLVLGILAPLPGCIVNPYRGTHQANTSQKISRLAEVPHGQSTCACQGHGERLCSEECTASGDEPGCAAGCDPGFELPADDFATCDEISPANCQTAPCDNITDPACLNAVPSYSLALLHCAASLPVSAFAGIAHGCIPAATMGPPEIPPPGRFHPVPTRPVFTPRDEAVATIPSGL
ncbi:MAG: hypothetical protein L0Z07_09055 [Planctomycetes bacterium]|nr:hypothetical protein [Planctomycetota bacterium]